MKDACDALVQTIARNRIDGQPKGLIRLARLKTEKSAVDVNFDALLSAPSLPPFGGKAAIESVGTQVVTLGLSELIRNALNYMIDNLRYLGRPARLLYSITCQKDCVTVTLLQPVLRNDAAQQLASNTVRKIRELEQHFLNAGSLGQIAETKEFIAVPEGHGLPTSCCWARASWTYCWKRITWSDDARGAMKHAKV